MRKKPCRDPKYCGLQREKPKTGFQHTPLYGDLPICAPGIQSASLEAERRPDLQRTPDLEQTMILLFLLACVIAFFVPAIQNWICGVLRRTPALVWAIPFLLTAIFAAASAMAAAFSIPLTAIVLLYTLAPTASAVQRFDFLTVLLLWLPIEFAGALSGFVPRPAQGFLHSVAYGIAILLGLTLFLGFRNLPGMKYNTPRGLRDLWLPFAAYAMLAPVLMIIGVAIRFIPLPHAAHQTPGRMAAIAAIIFVGTALPEEILFRSLIQNLVQQRFGENTRALLLASAIFGAAHLDNGPQALPNWRYMILATIAGFAYGKVFQKGSTVLSSACLHMLVDWTKHIFF